MIKWLLKKLLTRERATSLALDWTNRLLSRIRNAEKAAEVADIVAHVAGALEALVPVLKSEPLRHAVAATVDAVSVLAKAVRDLAVSTDECDLLVGAVEDCVGAWRDWSGFRDADKPEEIAA